MPVVDGSSIEDFSALPDGTYDCELESFENKQAKTDQSANVTLKFNVTEDSEFTGRKIFVTHNLKPQSLWSFKRTCVALGADPEDFAGPFDTDDMLGQLRSAPCRIRVTVNPEGHPYAGKQNVEEIMAMSYDFAG